MCQTFQITLFLILLLITAENGFQTDFGYSLFRFEISGNGYFAFLNADGVNSSRGFDDMKWICNKPRV